MSGLFGGGTTKATTKTTSSPTTINRLPAMPYSLNTGFSSMVVSPSGGTVGSVPRVTAPNVPTPAMAPVTANPGSPQFLPTGYGSWQRDQIYIPVQDSMGRNVGYRTPTQAGMAPNTTMGGVPTGQVIPQTGSAGPANVSLTLDPNIRNLTMEGVDTARAGYGRVLNTITDLNSARNPFIQARVAPYEEAAAANRAGIQRDLGRRNVFGSLGTDVLSKYDAGTARTLGDQRALATQESLQASLAAEATARGYGEDIRSGAQQILAQELSALGLSQQGIQTLIESMLPMGQSGGDSTSTASQKQPADIFGTLGKIASTAGMFV